MMTLAFLCLSAPPLVADEVLVAVASNFIQPMKVLAKHFEAETGHQAKLAFGSSGKLFAQIHHGAPFDVFLSADKDKVSRLFEKGQAVEGSDFVYARGRLVLWSMTLKNVDVDVLKEGQFKYLALANPKLAPYGAAAHAILASLGLSDSLKSKQVVGENIAQTFQFVQTGNADLGFVALSQINGLIGDERGSAWLIPGGDYPPIEQHAVTLKAAANNPAAKALTLFLQQNSSQVLIRSFGYD